jgi:hypothetical protein
VSWWLRENRAALERSEQLAITCTRRALAAVRLWFVASTAPYDGVTFGQSLSGLLETDDERGTRGALAQYAGYLGRERRHRIQGMLLSRTAEPTEAPVPHALEVAKLRETDANLRVTAVNLKGSAMRLAASLGPHRGDERTGGVC